MPFGIERIEQMINVADCGGFGEAEFQRNALAIVRELVRERLDFDQLSHDAEEQQEYAEEEARAAEREREQMGKDLTAAEKRIRELEKAVAETCTA